MEYHHTDPRSPFNVVLLEVETLLNKLKNDEIDRREIIGYSSFSQEFLDCVWNIERLSDTIENLTTIK